MRPREVVIEVTSTCNFRCSNCFNRASFAENGRGAIRMDAHFIGEVLRSLAAAGVERVRFTGGEPLSRPDIFELMRQAKDLGLQVWMNSNATLVNEENVRVIEKLVDNVLISFNGYDRESDTAWTSVNSFENKIRGVRLLKDSGVKIVRAGTVLTPKNVRNLEKISEVVKGLNLSGWEVYRAIELKEQPLNYDIAKIMDKLAVISLCMGKAISIANAIPFCAHDMKMMSLFCSGGDSDDGHSRIFVDPRGFAKPSYYINENLGDPRDILSCWNHPFVKSMRNLEMVPAKCRGCEFLPQCKGGSRYAAYLTFGKYDERDPLMPEA